MAEHLYDGWLSSFGLSLNNLAGSEVGVPITVQRTGTIYKLRYYHRVSGDTAPTSLALWTWIPGAGNPSLQERVTLPSPGSTTGWIDVDLVTPYDVGPGDTIVVSGTKATTWDMAYRSDASAHYYPRTLVTGLGIWANWAYVIWASGGSFAGGGPTTVGFDVEWDAAPFGDFTLSELTDEFERWLTAGGDKYPDSDLPAIKGQAEGANTNAENAWTTAQLVQTDLGEFRDEWPGTLATALQGGLTTIGDWLSTESDWYQTLVNTTAPQVADLVDAVGMYTGISALSYLSDLIRWANGLNKPPAIGTATYYERGDAYEFTDSIHLPVQAEAYEYELDGDITPSSLMPYGDQTRYVRAVTWAPIDGDFFEQMRYCDGRKGRLHADGRTLPGIILRRWDHGTGTVWPLVRIDP